MKLIFLIMLWLPIMATAKDLVSIQEYTALSHTQKIQVLQLYKKFVQEALKNGFENENLNTRFNFSFIQQAYASEKFNCFYAGWPSLQRTVTVEGKKKTFCTSPLKSNTAYKSLAVSCGKNQLLCQPVLFGPELCIEAKTQSQRNLAFSQCQKKFIASGKSMDEVAKSLSSPEIAPLADEMFELVHAICNEGPFQSKTGMCTNLKKQVAAIKELKPETKKTEIAKPVQIINEGKVIQDEVLENKLISSVQKIDHINEVSHELNRKVACDQCEQIRQIEAIDEVLAPHEASEAIDQSKKTQKDFCAGGQKGTDIDKYSQGIFSDYDNGVSINVSYQEKDKDKKNRVVGGFDIYSDKMGQEFPYVEDGQEYSTDEMELMSPKRVYSNDFLGRGKEAVFEIIDSPVKEVYENKKLKDRYISTDMRITQYTFFPRNNVPSIKKREDKLIMKLTTGEEMMVDAKTGRIIAGVGKELPPKKQIETRPNDKRIFPDSDFSYQGEGLFIESKVTYNKDERKPGSLVPVKALVEGKWQECKLKSEDIWSYDYGHYLPQGHDNYLSSSWSCTRLKFEKDEDLYNMIKKTCPTFKFPALIK